MTRLSYLAAPALIFGYGVVRLIDGLDGTHGPGPAWTIGHLLFLVALLLFGAVLVGLRSQVERQRGIATAAVVVGCLGLLAFIRVVLVDLIVGWQSVDRPDMNRRYDRYDGFPGGLPSWLTGLLDNLGPALFVTGLLVLTLLLTVRRPRLLAWWSPVSVVLAFAAISLDLDLLPLGGALLALALYPVARRGHSGHSGATIETREAAGNPAH